MGGEEVIELSVDETNALRASLGLKPLQITKSSATDQDIPNANVNAKTSQEELKLSVEESNNLRAKLGLKPLKVNTTSSIPSGRKSSEAIHAPAQNTREKDEIAKRLQQAKLKREVEAGISKIRQENGGLSSLGGGDENGGGNGAGVLSWADQMRKKSTSTATVTENAAKMKKKKERVTTAKYTDSDFENQNLTVSHAMADFDAGATTVLTLADKSILELDVDNEENNEHTLENVNLSESAMVKDNLKRKRMLEMGIGHAGGYAGYDDDEFEELGGTQKITLGGAGGGINSGNGEETKKKTGFKLGAQNNKEANDDLNGGGEDSNLFAAMNGKSISLLSGNNESVHHQADFLSYEEDEAMTMALGSFGASKMSKEQIEKRRKKKEKKMKKKLKKEKKKDRKRRKEDDDKVSEISNNNDNGNGNGNGSSNVNSSVENNVKPLLEDLLSNPSNQKRRKRQRRRQRGSDTEDSDVETTQMGDGDAIGMKEGTKEDEDIQKERKKKFDSIMEKANERTLKKVGEQIKSLDNDKLGIKKSSSAISGEEEDDEADDDDAFLTAALTKARRLRRLKELSEKANEGENSSTNSDTKRAHAVLDALKKSQQKHPDNDPVTDASRNNGQKITFELGTTTEFTRALRARPSHVENNKSKEAEEKSIAQTDLQSNEGTVDKSEEDATMKETSSSRNDTDDGETLEDLAHHVEEEKDDLGAFGSTGSTVGVGRGLSAFLGMLQHTGEISGKTGGKEEMRGRAKDERTYDDYAPLNLKEVVKIDSTGLNGTPHDKDVELANREVKLEYRDEHGRLLTRKEAYRQLCYQFHGHGSSKKKEEKRLQQIEREQAERSVSGRSSSGTLGLQKATQKATGKAFIVRRT